MSTPIIKFTTQYATTQAPKRGHEKDICFDVRAVKRRFTLLYIEYDTDIAIEPPEGYAVKAHARSSVSDKRLMLKNGVGLIDPHHRKSIKFRFRYSIWSLITGNIYRVGDRIGQVEVFKTQDARFRFVSELSETARGEGYGSTGK